MSLTITGESTHNDFDVFLTFDQIYGERAFLTPENAAFWCQKYLAVEIYLWFVTGLSQ